MKKKKKKNNTFRNIYNIVSSIPKGKVCTYKRISEIVGTTPKIVGFALHVNKNPQSIPCHRVVNIKGELAKSYAFGGLKKQKEKLEAEKVFFLTNNIIDLEKCFYSPLSSSMIESSD